jgi:hypothetical protein
MAAKSYYLDDAILNLILSATPYVPTTGSVYVALYTVAPTALGGGTEVPTAGGTLYVRQAVTFGTPTNGVVSNSAPVAFPTAGIAWNTIVACGIFDDVSGGHLLYFGNLGTPKLVGIGDQVNFATSALSVTEQ